LALTPSTRLGVYEVIAQIGEGGMGQVYRARDLTLHRDVALKVLPDVFRGRRPPQSQQFSRRFSGFGRRGGRRHRRHHSA